MSVGFIVMSGRCLDELNPCVVEPVGDVVGDLLDAFHVRVPVSVVADLLDDAAAEVEPEANQRPEDEGYCEDCDEFHVRLPLLMIEVYGHWPRVSMAM